MKVLFVNPIIYTSETKDVKKRDSIKDTMSYGLCCAFKKAGHDITLYACEDYKPLNDENYPFTVVFEKATMVKFCHPNVLPRLPKLKRYLKNNDFDLIVCSEAFALTTYACVKACPKKVIVWQELAAYQHAFHELPAKFWYKHIVRHHFKNAKIVARSERAKQFISQFSHNVSDITIDHGVDLDQFVASKDKRNQFIVVSQLIPRKRIDKTISIFVDFCHKYGRNYKLVIIGDGISKKELMTQAGNSDCADLILFKGFMSHDELMDDFSHSLAMLVNTEKDNNILTLNEALACCCPIVTNRVPFLAEWVENENVGIAKNNWDMEDLKTVIDLNEQFVSNCFSLRNQIDYSFKVRQFTEVEL